MMEALGQGNISREQAADHLRKHSLSIEESLSSSDQSEAQGKESDKGLEL